MTPIPYKSFYVVRLASNGGQGSFSYSDTSVYGPRENRGFGYSESRKYDNAGQLISITKSPMGSRSPAYGGGGPIIPGGGGGAKLPGKRYFGSRAVGFNPDGAVVIRLFKVN